MNYKNSLIDDEVELIDRYGEKYWFDSSKRKLIRKFVSGGRVLVLGPGAGHLIQELVSDGLDVSAIDISVMALGLVRKKVSAELILGDAVLLPLKESSFDCVIAADILEHIKSDSTSLHEINRVLVDNGKLILTVPAKEVLWSEHDKRMKHFRRYEKGRLRRLLVDARFEVVKLQYWNIVSYPFVYLNNLLRGGEIQRPDRANNQILNRILPVVLHIEGLVSFLPVGVNLFVVCRKKA